MIKQTEIVHDFDESGQAVFIVQCFQDRFQDEPEIERRFIYLTEAQKFARDYLYDRVAVEG